MTPLFRTTPASPNSLSDEQFWLAQVDDDLPRAGVAPDRKRRASGARRHETLSLSFDAEVLRLLRASWPEHGLSDTLLCAGLLGLWLGKSQRDDRTVLGLKAALPGSAAAAAHVLPMVVQARADHSFQALITDLHAQLAEMGRRDRRVVSELPRILGMDNNSGRHPLLDMVIVVAEAQPTLDLSEYPVDIALLFATGSEQLKLDITYDAGIYERNSIQRFGQQLERLAAQVADATRAQRGPALQELQWLSPHERTEVLHTFNARNGDYPLTQTLHGLFEAQALRSPNAVAAIHRNERLSYGELDRRANQLANALLARGLGKGEFVGILLQRGCDFLVAMLAAFKAGGAYVPLDPTYPRERVAYMLQDSAAKLLITDAVVGQQYEQVVGEAPSLRTVLSTRGELSAAAWPSRSDLTVVQPAQWQAAASTRPELGLVGGDRAYMIYTSGSTGRPKGAICRHDGAINHLFGELEGVGVSGAFNFLQTAASSSDISVWQFLAPTLFGGATVVADYETVVDPVLLATLMRQERINVAEPVPVVLRALIDHLGELPPTQRALPDLKVMMCTGEALPGELVDRWLALYPHIPVGNTYGPTETSDDVTLYVMREPVAERHAVAPIGQPLPNVRMLVLDRQMQPVPVGVPGEVCIAGVAVGEGYWQQPDKTSAAFVPCPFPELASGLMYRTGDLGCWLPDGAIEFLGRLDQQVKVRGFRIEPGEIEQAMTRHTGVQDAAVVAMTDGQGNKRLVGYFVAKSAGVTSAELRAFLKSHLADHMVPATLVTLQALPLTPLGKVDRRSLARMDISQALTGSDAHLAPRTAAEQAVAAAFAQALGVAQVGATDNFFELGGDSILTISTVAALRERGYHAAPRQLFLHPTVAELAEHLADAGTPSAQTADQTPAAWEPARWRDGLLPMFPDLIDVYPLSATQRGIYFQGLLTPKTSGAYVEQIGLDLVGNLNAQALHQACTHWAQTAEPLRTVVVRRGGAPLQVVLREASLAPATLDLSTSTPEQQGQRLAALELEERMKGFDLKRAPLARLTVVKLAQDRHRLLLSYHHLILDGWSEPLLLGALLRAYQAVASGLTPQAPDTTPYRHFVAWLEQRDASGSEAFWRRQLAGFTQPTNLQDPSPAISPPAGGEVSHGWDVVVLPRATQAALELMGRRNGITLSTVLHGAWAMLISRNTMQTDVMFGSVSSGRQCDMPGIEAVHGLVVATQALRTRVNPELSLSAWLRLLQLQMAEVREHEHTPLASVQNWSEIAPEKRPMFDSLVVVGNYSGSDLAACAPPGLAIENVAYRTQPLYGLTLFVTVGADVQISLVYDRKRFAPTTANQLNLQLVHLLASMGENADQRMGGLVERRRAPRLLDSMARP